MPVLSTELVAQRLGVSQHWVRKHRELFVWWALPGRGCKRSVTHYIASRQSPRTLAGIIRKVKEESHA